MCKILTIAIINAWYFFVIYTIRTPPGFEMFYNPPIMSTLCLPSSWYCYEFGMKLMEGLTSNTVISGKQDVKSLGYFDSGVSMYYFMADTAELKDKLAESLR
jgi:hypothetical protein